MSPRPYAAALATIVFAGALARVVLLLLWIPTQPVSDFYGSFRVAQNVAATGRFEAKPGVPGGGRSPAYPILLSPILNPASATRAPWTGRSPSAGA
jgi:hypothetical protein